MPGNVPADPYDTALSALRNHVEDVSVWITIWEARAEPGTHAFRCASNVLRGRPVRESRDADDAAAACADALLARRRDGTS